MLARQASPGLSSTSRTSGFFTTVAFAFARGWVPGQGELEGRTLARLRFHPDAAAVLFDHLLADGQPQPVAGILLAGVQPAEDDKDAFRVLRRDSDTVVAHGKHPLVGFLAGRDIDLRRLGT